MATMAVRPPVLLRRIMAKERTTSFTYPGSAGTTLCDVRARTFSTGNHFTHFFPRLLFLIFVYIDVGVLALWSSGRNDSPLTDARFLATAFKPQGHSTEHAKHQSISGRTANTCKPQGQLRTSPLHHLNPASPTCPFSRVHFRPSLPTPPRPAATPQETTALGNSRFAFSNFRSDQSSAAPDRMRGGAASPSGEAFVFGDSVEIFLSVLVGFPWDCFGSKSGWWSRSGRYHLWIRLLWL
ncbi:hypothetical protein PR202_gb19782 [Eleusine coracana subsp. coracana]|uniref:Uncharacterized protein n=1 Tax=Eleusine coracana subsp. coracana TaxID=191504 RepID=A0AAV5F6W3_ELECO|nr:hypothetical protein PR202_gb19782 [Eleusine coracana subsp. coracana]